MLTKYAASDLPSNHVYLDDCSVFFAVSNEKGDAHDCVKVIVIDPLLSPLAYDGSPNVKIGETSATCIACYGSGWVCLANCP